MCYYSSMKMLNTIATLGDVAAYQRGIFTSAQARRRGVERYELSRLEKAGAVERLAHGVYRMAGAPCAREEDVLAAWLSLVPEREPGERGFEVVASGATSAWLQQLGELLPDPLEFSCAARRQTQRPGLRLKRRAIDPSDVVVAAGVPATSAARTVLDLIDDGEDASLVASVLADALSRDLVPDERALREQVDARAKGLGLPEGASLYDRMTAKGCGHGI